MSAGSRDDLGRELGRRPVVCWSTLSELVGRSLSLAWPGLACSRLLKLRQLGGLHSGFAAQ